MATTDALGNTTQYVYDKLGRQIEEIQPDPDASGPPTVTTLTTYDDVHDKVRHQCPGLCRLRTSTTRPRPITTSWAAVIEVIQPAPATGQARPTTYYHYDADGNLDGVEDARGAAPTSPANLATFDPAHTTKYVYDQTDRKIEEILPDPSGGSDTLTTSYTLDGNGNVIAVTTPGINTAATLTTDYVYDNLNRKIEDDPTGPCHGHDQRNRPQLPEDHLGLRPERQSGLHDGPQRQRDPLRLQPRRPADASDRRPGRHDHDRLRRGGQRPGGHDRRPGMDDDVSSTTR